MRSEAWSLPIDGTPNRITPVHALTLAGFALIGIGVFLPWVGEPQARVYVLGMESGFERQWGKRLLLGAGLGTALVLASLATRVRWAVVGPILGAIGAVTILVAVITSPLTGQWPTGIGVYVTIAGGLLVVGATLVPVLALVRRD